MPIKPENKGRYPANWKQIRADIIKRANNRCEFCGVENHTTRENGAKVVLTIAHLDHTPENCDYNNLRALCQKCHNSYDALHRAVTRREAKRKAEILRAEKCAHDELLAAAAALDAIPDDDTEFDAEDAKAYAEMLEHLATALKACYRVKELGGGSNE